MQPETSLRAQRTRPFECPVHGRIGAGLTYQEEDGVLSCAAPVDGRPCGQPVSRDDDLVVRVCDCGAIAHALAGARCRRDARHNMSSACPTRRMRIVAWEEVGEGGSDA